MLKGVSCVPFPFLLSALSLEGDAKHGDCKVKKNNPGTLKSILQFANTFEAGLRRHWADSHSHTLSVYAWAVWVSGA